MNAGAVAVVDVEIDDRDPLDAAPLQHARRDGDVVERAEALAVVRKRVVQTASDVAELNQPAASLDF